MRSTFKVLFIIRASRLNKAGLATLMIRITIDKKYVEFSSKMSVSPENWDAKVGKMKGRSKSSLEINNAIDFMLTRLNNKYQVILEKDGCVSAEKLRDHFLGIEEAKHSLIKLFQKKIDQKKALSGNTIQESAVNKYECTKKKIEEFLLFYYQNSDILIKDVEYEFISNFDIFLRSKHNCGHNTVVRHMRYLKQVTTDALRCRLILVDPFYDFPLSSRKANRKYLTEAEMLLIINKQFATEVLDQVRDFFIFCCMTGLAYIDVVRLRKRDIIEEANGDKFIIKNRAKTGNESFVPLLEIPLSILKKYEGSNLPDERLLPVCACQNMNLYIKEIAAICGINKNLSSHCGRHTFATAMLTKGVSIESVSKMLGHTDIKTTQIYAKILNQKVVSEVNQVRSAFNDMNKHYAEFEVIE